MSRWSSDARAHEQFGGAAVTKTLPKSLRPSYRYVFFEVETLADRRIRERDLRMALWFEAQNLYGDATSARTELDLVEYGDGLAVAKCRHDRVDEARAAVACVDSVEDVDVGCVVVGVSGTLDAGRERYQPPGEPEETEVDGDPAWRRGPRVDVRRGGQQGVLCGTTYEFKVTDDAP